MRVLAVDDNDACLRALSDVVQAAGFELAGCARCGEEAVRLHAELRPDLVLLDLYLPDIDGRETARRMLEAGQSSRIVLMSAFPSAGILAKATLTPQLLVELSR